MQNPFVPARARCPRTEFGLRAALVATLTLALDRLNASIADRRRAIAMMYDAEEEEEEDAQPVQPPVAVTFPRG